MKNNIIKIIFIIEIFITILTSCLTTTCMAASMSDAEKIMGIKDEKINNSLTAFMNNAAGFTQIVAAGVATAMLLAISIKYMMASTAEKADLKQHAVVYVFGAILLYAGVAIVEIIKNFMGAL